MGGQQGRRELLEQANLGRMTSYGEAKQRGEVDGSWDEERMRWRSEFGVWCLSLS